MHSLEAHHWGTPFQHVAAKDACRPSAIVAGVIDVIPIARSTHWMAFVALVPISILVLDIANRARKIHPSSLRTKQ